MTAHYVAHISDIPRGQRIIVDIEGRSIGVFNVKGNYYALLNYCPHQGAELCKGKICGTNIESEVYQFNYSKDEEIIRCPWHGWEFDIKTGQSLFDKKVRTKSYKVEVINDKIYIKSP